MRSPRAVGALAAVLLLASACSGTSDGGADEPLDVVGAWRLVSGASPAGEIIPSEESPVTLEVADDLTVGGRSACNRYSGSVEVGGSAVTFSPLASTMMACPEPVMTVETQYLSALAGVDSGTRDGETLTLTGEDVELVFETATTTG